MNEWYFLDCDGKDSHLKFYVPIVSLAVFLAIAVGVVIYQRRQISATPSQRGPAESSSQQKQTSSSPNYVDLTFTEEGSEYMSLDTVKWESFWIKITNAHNAFICIKQWTYMFNCISFAGILKHGS